MMARHPVAFAIDPLVLSVGALVARPSVSTIVVTIAAGTAARVALVLTRGLVDRFKERERRRTLLEVMAQQQDAKWPTRVVQTKEGLELSPIDAEPTTDDHQLDDPPSADNILRLDRRQ